MDGYINIGKFVAPFGLRGELILKHVLHKKTTFKNVEALFVEMLKNSYLPYFLEYASPKNEEEIHVKLEGVDSKEAAKKITQKNVWLTENDFNKIKNKTSPIALLGYHVINDRKDLGLIEEVIEQPHQVLLWITINNKEALIPLHEKTLDKIDHKKKLVYVILPDGLLEIYQ